MVVDGPMDGELFLAWVEQFLCPTLQAGDIAILDNLSSHKVEGFSKLSLLRAQRCSIYRPIRPI